VDSAAAASGVPAEQIAAAAKVYAASKNPVIVFGTGISANEEASLQALNLALVKNAGVLPLMLEANALGVMQMGCLPTFGPGFTKAKKAGKSYEEMKKGMKALFIVGNIPDTNLKADTLIVMASHENALSQKADLVLPLASLYEKQGSIVNTYGAAKSFNQAQPPAGEIKDGLEAAWIISAAMSKTKAFKAKDVAGLMKKIKAGKLAAGSFKPVKPAAAKPYGVSATVLLMAMNQGMLSGSAVIKVISAKQPALQR
jgi:predicted molibdopterin-dependent oxidoreductase YjgC